MHFWFKLQHAKNWKPSFLPLQKEIADKTENQLLSWIHWRTKFTSKSPPQDLERQVSPQTGESRGSQLISVYLKEKILEPSLRWAWIAWEWETFESSYLRGTPQFHEVPKHNSDLRIKKKSDKYYTYGGERRFLIIVKCNLSVSMIKAYYQENKAYKQLILAREEHFFQSPVAILTYMWLRRKKAIPLEKHLWKSQ